MPEWVFTQPNGKPLTATTAANRMFHRCLDKAGLRRVRFHDLRHSFASILIQQKESLAYVKEQMGHHSIQMTMDLYGHLAPDGNKSAVDKLDSVDFDTVGRNQTQPGRNHKKKRLKNQPLTDDGAGNGIRTRDFNLGKVALYPLSYSRLILVPISLTKMRHLSRRN